MAWCFKIGTRSILFLEHANKTLKQNTHKRLRWNPWIYFGIFHPAILRLVLYTDRKEIKRIRHTNSTLGDAVYR